jgi:Fur family ferric uptake transcriptional regulator
MRVVGRTVQPVTTVRRSREAVPADRHEMIERLRRDGHTVGRTRTAILDVVLAMTEAFTADELVAAVGNVHAATVYRSLALFEEIGVVRHVHVSHGPAIYERTSTAAGHQHLACERCGRHISVPATVFAAARRALERDHAFHLDATHFAILGRCATCAADEDITH